MLCVRSHFLALLTCILTFFPSPIFASVGISVAFAIAGGLAMCTAGSYAYDASYGNRAYYGIAGLWALLSIMYFFSALYFVH